MVGFPPSIAAGLLWVVVSRWSYQPRRNARHTRNPTMGPKSPVGCPRLREQGLALPQDPELVEGQRTWLRRSSARGLNNNFITWADSPHGLFGVSNLHGKGPGRETSRESE